MLRLNQGSEYNSSKPPIGSVLRNDGHWSVNGLVGCWLFNEGGGAGAVNLVNNKRLQLTSGMTWYRDGLNFSGGTSDYVSLGVSAAVPLTLVIDGVFTSVNGTNYALSLNSSGSLGFVPIYGNGPLLSLGTGGHYRRWSPATNPGTSQITAIITNTNPLSGLNKAYRNGILQNVSHNTSGTAGAITDLGIGNATSRFTGKLKYYILYNRTLSAQEIVSLNENPYQMVQTRPNASVTIPRTVDPSKNLWRMT